jgi:hypothetical protein
MQSLQTRHSANVILQPVVIPFSAVPPHLRERLGLPKRPSVTRDGRLTCSCSAIPSIALQARHTRRQAQWQGRQPGGPYDCDGGGAVLF